MTSHIWRVTNVKVTTCKCYPPLITVNADGEVTTGGWTDPQLVPYVYLAPPTDGIYDFSFVASKPEGIVTQQITPISVEFTFEEPSKGMHGVRIHASSNSMVGLLAARGEAVVVRGVLTDEGVECQTLRTDEDELYTLVGDLSGFRVGDEVVVSGTTATASFCMQGTTLVVNWISKQMTKAAARI